MVTTGYAVVLCGWLIYLAVQVIRQRRKHQVLFAGISQRSSAQRLQLQKAGLLLFTNRTGY